MEEEQFPVFQDSLLPVQWLRKVFRCLSHICNDIGKELLSVILLYVSKSQLLEENSPLTREGRRMT